MLATAPSTRARQRSWRLGPAAWSPSHDRRAVALLVLVALALRLPNVERSYWVDEGISIGIAGHPIAQIPGLLRHDGSPPLFYLVLHYWLAAFGTSELATHMLPLLVSLCVVVVAWWCGRTLAGRAAGLGAAALVATNPYLTWYATETRMYTLITGLGMLLVTFAVRARRDRRAADVGAAVVVAIALVYSHNWGLYLVAAVTVVAAALELRSGDRAGARVVALGAAAVAAAYLPWLPSLAAQAASTAAPWAVPPGIGDLIADPSTLVGGTLGVIVVPALVLGAVATRRERPQSGRNGLELLVGAGGLTLVAGWLAAQLEPSWTVRYLAVVYGSLVLAAAVALAGTRRGRSVLVGVCVLCAAWEATGSVLPNPAGREAKSNVAAIVAAARPYLGRGDLVVVAQTEQLAVAHHYLPADLTYVTPTGPVADPSYVDWDHIVARLATADVCATVAPSIAALPPGASVLVIDPLRPIGASATAWSRVANGDVEAIARLAASQTSLVATRSFIDGTTKPRPYSAVVGELYVKTAGPVTCPG